MKFLGEYRGNALIFWLSRETIQVNMPSVFKKSHQKLRSIVDCSEVAIERPRSPCIQAATWSEYKKSNTFKFLIGISPTGYILFLSECYGGRCSDTFICQNISFYNKLQYADEIMADRGLLTSEYM